jgi:hypothetical protein
VDPNAGTVQRVWDTVVPLDIDGQAAEIRIDLDWVPGSSPWLAAVLPLLLAVALSTVLLVRPTAAPATLAAAATAALGASAAAWLATPPGGDVEPALLVLPALTLVLLVVGRAMARRGRGMARRGAGSAPAAGPTAGPTRRDGGRWLLVGAAVPLLVWGIVLSPVLVRPIAPGPLPIWFVRGVTAAALAAGAAVVVVVGRRLLAAPDPPLAD